MKLLRGAVVAFLLGITMVSCSIFRGDDSEKNVRKFLADFQTNLTQSDDAILAPFRVEQSREAVLLMIGILQNKDPFIVCETPFANAKITRENEIVLVEIPTLFHTKELDSSDSAYFTLKMWLTPLDDRFTITKINGEEFYQEFQRIKNNNQWRAAQKIAEKERLPMYELARNLEGKFDSVIWYTAYQKESYFYVVTGNWQNYFTNYETRHQKNKDVLMGIANAQGELVIPIEYELIGTLGFERSNLVEVTKNGKHGYFDLERKQLVVEPVYDLIIPYGKENAFAIVKQDSVYGWLDEQYQFTEGFASTSMEEWYTNFDYLKRPVKLIPGNYVFCEIPSSKHLGEGIIMPPSYFASNGIFDEIEGDISTSYIPTYGSTEYKETLGSFMESIGNNLRALVTTIRERYIEGREEFYSRTDLVILDDTNKRISTAQISGEQVRLDLIDSTLLEVRTPHNEWWFMDNETCDELNLLKHTYFSLGKKYEITPLKSSRLYQQTEFVKMDSSYLVGKFRVFNRATGKEEETTFLSVKTITYMRDEILASYGYKPEEEGEDYFGYLRKKDTPTYTRMEEFEEKMTPIDKHNFNFLNIVLVYMQSPA